MNEVNCMDGKAEYMTPIEKTILSRSLMKNTTDLTKQVLQC